MTESVINALIGAAGVVFVAIIGGLVAILRDSRQARSEIAVVRTEMASKLTEVRTEITSTRADVARVVHQVFPNGGGSILDKVSQLKTDLDSSRTERRGQIDAIHRRMDEVLIGRPRFDPTPTQPIPPTPGGTT
ncbi:hypothetical protein D1871_11170 [Nakamurella silvestris]|nr:hypothetical protein D1871_11170 [Nakamurella silvestris]